jgi:hypothetical protein
MRRTAVMLVTAGVLALTAACSDSAPDAASGSPQPSGTTSSSAPPSGPATIPTASTPSLTPLPTPSEPWPTPVVPGKPDADAPLARRIQFAVAKQAQIAAGKAARTTVSCPGIDAADQPGRHQLNCTITYAGKSYPGTLTVDAKQYSATYKFSSDSVAIVKAKVVDAVQRSAQDAAKVTCTMDAVAVVKHTDAQGIACDVTTVANAVQPYRAQVSGDGRVLVTKA